MFTHDLTTYQDRRLGMQYRATVYLDGQWWMEWTGSLDYVTDHLADDDHDALMTVRSIVSDPREPAQMVLACEELR